MIKINYLFNKFKLFYKSFKLILLLKNSWGKNS